MGKGSMAATVIILFVLGALLCMVGCTGETYRVDYSGQKDFYKGAKDSYRAGREVTLYYTLIATDTDYSFYIDGESINFDYDNRKGFIIRFTMPAHDVKLECRAKESMVYVPEQGVEESNDIMLFSCYREMADGNGYHELAITTTNDAEKVRLDEYIKEDGEETQTTFYIPYEVVQELLLLTEEYGFYDWNDMEDGLSLDGTKKACMFWGREGYIQVSTDRMPEDGEEKLDTLFELMKSYANDGSEE